MQLTQLEIKGFKSFGDKITINFNEGVTAIVGPNGCGKSNVIDAIRWVLGEQSTRMLRSEKMENIIFNGNRTRKPSNLAEVSLSFNNSKNILPTEFTEVTITRKLYRTGESEYRLNEVQCRLKDITDLFLDTGIGSDSYSIIELKMIDEIITNKENSRRALFEEASGISKYKLRKKQTFNRLKETEVDLSRVEDILFEIEKNLKTLENQAKKAEKYYLLKDQYKVFSIQLAHYRISSFREKLSSLEAQEQTQTVEKNKLTTDIDRLESDLQNSKLDSLTKEKNLSVQQKAANEFTSKIRAYESEKKLKNEQFRFLNDKKKRITDELAVDQNQLNHVLYSIKRLGEEHFQETENLDNLIATLDNHQREVENIKNRHQALKQEVDLASFQNNELQNQIYKLEKELAILNIQLEALAQENQRNVADTQSKEQEINEFNKVLAGLQLRFETMQSEYNLSEKFEADLQEQVIQSTDLIAHKKEEASKLSRKLDSKQNEYNLTKSLVDNLEGFPESIRFLKKNTSWAKQAPLLSDIFYCLEEYRIALENYLEPVLNHYVVQNQQEAVQAIKLLSDAGKGKANFFILDAIGKIAKVNADLINNKNDTDFISALEVITINEKHRPLCELLLRNVYLLKSENDSFLSDPLPENGIIILSGIGKFSKSRIAMSGGSVGLFEGKRIGRAKNLENLIKEIKDLEIITTSLKKDVDIESERLIGLKLSSQKQTIALKQQDIHRLQNELITIKTKQTQYEAFIENSQNRKHDIEQRIHSINHELLISTPKLNELKTLKEIKLEQLSELQHDYNDLAAELNNKSSVYNQENIRFHQQKNKVANLAKDQDYRDSQLKNLEKKINLNNTELHNVQKEIEDTAVHADHSDEELMDMYLQKDALEKGVQDAEIANFLSRALITETENNILALRRKKDNCDVLFNELKDLKTDLKLELNALKERLSVEFSIELADLLDEENLPEEEENTLKEKTDRIKKQLNDFGSINSMAMEAYKEMNERYSFIIAQRTDLQEAKASLLQTIHEIENTACEKFMDAFSTIREHFIHVFRSLFNEEDSCDLVLTDPKNPLESDIDILARPKGKRPLSINQLSGGEKTLTATALLFSLYLLKPAPFCIFDEVDAPLDDTNIDKFNNIIRKFSDKSQFIIVSHNKRTIASTDIIYGVTMVEQGVSKVVAVDIREVA